VPTEPTTKRAKAKPGGGKGGLNRKVGPLPVYGWVIAAVGAYLLIGFVGKSSSKTTPAASGTAGKLGTATDGSGSTGGASGSSGDASGGGFDAYANLVNALLGANSANLDAFKAALDGGTGAVTNNTYNTITDPKGSRLPAGSLTGSTSAGASSIPTPEQAGSLNPPAPIVGSSASTIFGNLVSNLAYQQGLQNPTMRVPASSPAFAAQSVGKTQGAAAAQVPVAYGGVASVKRLPNGSSLTTYVSGRQVQQMPGKTAYVVKA
jgi:hypothetical protein